ncbi:MAG: ABC transporter substrate-binding protein [Gemmatimonadota bacterium]|nr:ABC transporter substrate-binding protein [Gemmatimonadota bacterium]
MRNHKIDHLVSEFSRGRIDRREFMGMLVAAGVGISSAGALATRAALAAGPKKGGHFRLGMADFATTDSLEPALLDTRMQQNITFQLRNCLVEVLAGGDLGPELAESWEGSKDATRWTFKLRKGVEFHNGKSLTPADVIWSINHHLGEDSTSAVKPFFSGLKEMKATGANEITFVLESGNQDFPALMAYYSIVIVPEGTTNFDDGMGTGGYVLENFEPGVRSLVKRAPNYWKENAAHFDSVEIIAIGDSTARHNALVSGEIDAYNFVDLKTVHLLARRSNVNILRVSGKAHYAFACRTDTPPYDNNDARLALKYGINREMILQQILNGYGTLGNDHPLSPAYRFYNGSIPQRSYDPDKAKFHARKAGIDGMELSLHCAETPFGGATDAGVLYSEHLKACGINMKVVREPDDGFWNSVWAKKPFFATRWSGRVTEDLMFNLAYSASALETGWNETYFNSDRLNKLLAEARVEADEAKRAEMYGEIQLIIHEQGGTVTPVFADFVDVASDRIGHGPLSSDFDLDGCRASERWWFV